MHLTAPLHILIYQCMTRITLSNLPKTTKNRIITLYESGESCLKIATVMGFSQSFIHNILKNSNIKFKCTYDYYTNNKLNYEFFDKIDTEEKAYFLGFMFADGNVYRAKRPNKSTFNEISINLQEQDKYILEKFKILLAPGYKLGFLNKKKYNKNDNNQWRLKFSDKKIADQLGNLGCVPAKSLILEWPNWINNLDTKLIKHFIRGYYDGDGGISSYTDKYGGEQYAVKITSSKHFCDGIKKIIDINLNRDIGIYESGKIFDIRFGGNQQVYNFCVWLYDGANIYLARKYKKFQKLKLLLNK